MSHGVSHGRAVSSCRSVTEVHPALSRGCFLLWFSRFTFQLALTAVLFFFQADLQFGLRFFLCWQALQFPPYQQAGGERAGCHGEPHTASFFPHLSLPPGGLLKVPNSSESPAGRRLECFLPCPLSIVGCAHQGPAGLWK